MVCVRTIHTSVKLGHQNSHAWTLALQSVCKNEANARPCPRLVLVCCAALVTHGLETENLFLEEAPLDLVQFLIGSFQEGRHRHVHCVQAVWWGCKEVQTCGIQHFIKLR